MERGAVSDSPEYTGLGYNNKGVNFANTEEFILVKGVTDIEPQNLEKLTGLITAFSSGRVNINTAPEEVLGILINACVLKLQNGGRTLTASPENLRQKIIDHRKTNNFSIIGSLDADLGLVQNVDTDFIEIVNKLKGLAAVESQNFRIISTGKITGSNIERTIECVYDRQNRKTVSWHEN